ncbi:MAG: hypothetical protein PHF31_07675 [Methylobacter sp.]|nr:hypothetical protein [Methylobacter sp.]
MPKLSKDEWLAIKNKWSADPKLTYSDLAHEYEVSRQIITLRAKKESWQKTGDLAAINREALRRADGLTDAGVDKVDGVDKTLALKEESGLDTAIDKRVDILCKHRGQIIVLDSMQDSAKILFDTALKTKKKEDFWMAKIAADICKDHIISTSKKQMMERKCWGMDTLDLSPADLESFSEQELDDFCLTGKLPLRFRKIFRSFSDER